MTGPMIMYTRQVTFNFFRRQPHSKAQQRALERMSQTTQLEPLELELQARCFYWARKFKVEVDYLKYRDWKMAHSSEPPNHQVAHTSTPPTYSQSFSIDDLGANQPVATENNTSEILPSYTEPLSEDTLSPPAPYPPSFDEVVEMIQSGRGHLLPGIKTIPPTVLTDKITTSTVDLRKKPWEKDDVPPQAGGMFGDKRDIFINQEEE